MHRRSGFAAVLAGLLYAQDVKYPFVRKQAFADPETLGSEPGAMVLSGNNGGVSCRSLHAQRLAKLPQQDDSGEQVFDAQAAAAAAG